jgi:DNA-binding ferritin-like protein
MISLLFKIFADAAPWRKTVTQDLPKDAKAAGSAAGKEFGAQMKAAVVSYIGAGAILGVLKTQATKAAEIIREAGQSGLGVEAFQELKKASEATGLSIEQIQKMARELPADFEAMMEPIRKNGGIISEADAQSLAQVKAAMDEATNSAGKLFATLWEGGKALGNMVVNGAFAGAGAVASAAGRTFGSERLTEAGRFLSTTADIGAERMQGMHASPLSTNAAQSFAARARQIDEGNQWWESVGGNQDWSKQSNDVAAREIRAMHATLRERL